MATSEASAYSNEAFEEEGPQFKQYLTVGSRHRKISDTHFHDDLADAASVASGDSGSE